MHLHTLTTSIQGREGRDRQCFQPLVSWKPFKLLQYTLVLSRLSLKPPE